MNGFYRQREGLSLLMSQNNPLAVCLQETRLKPTQNAKLKNYTCYRKDYVNGDIACGGVATFVRNDTFSQEVPLVTDLQAVAVQVLIPHKVCICNVYLPPNVNVTQQQIVALVHQLPKPYILLGDVNAHNTIWGCDRVDQRGRTLEQFVNIERLTILNTGEPTHVTMATGTHSAIDLTICTTLLAPQLEWRAYDDTYGSDHYPIVTELLENEIRQERAPKWRLDKADWPRYTELAEVPWDPTQGIDEMVEAFTNALLAAALDTIPQTDTRPGKIPVPWWTPECKEAIRERRRALRRCKKRPTPENVEWFRICRANARQIIREAKKASWNNYISSVNSSTPVKEVWDKIRKIDGKSTCMSIPALEANGVLETTPEAVSNILADSFASISDPINYDPAFIPHKERAERRPPDFSTREDLDYNHPFSMWEMETALKDAKSSAPGQDQIHIEMLRHLSNQASAHLLQMYNRIWLEGIFPQQWKKAIVIPIYKTGKNKIDPKSYRPIALTSVLCKVMERMVNKRLVWFAEKHDLLSNEQCGFRQHRSTTDNLVKLENEIQNAFLNRQHLVAVSFDMEKAYDTTWRHGILKTLHGWGLRGHLPVFIREFMKDRVFSVRVGNTISDQRTQETGVPQGSVLSVTLFAVAINSIVRNISLPVKCSLYVDDFIIYCAARLLRTAQRQLQICINKLFRWSRSNGFKFSAQKTTVVHFHRLRGIQPEPELQMGGTPIPCSDNVRFLGLIFDSKLSWRPHLRSLKAKCQQPLNVLRVLSGKSYGADRVVLLRLYRALVRSKLDYGAIIYNSARPSYIKTLDPVHNTGLRLATGAFRSSPIESLCAEAGEPPLKSRRDLLTCNYIASLLSKPEHTTFECVFKPKHRQIYLNRHNTTRPLGIRARELLTGDLGIQYLPAMYNQRPSPIAPWKIPRPRVRMDLAEHKKDSTDPLLYRGIYSEVIDQYRDFTLVFTDGSKKDEDVGCAFVINNEEHGYCLREETSVFTSEMYAIWKALEHCIKRDDRYIVICTDSLSSLQTIEKTFPKNPLAKNIQECLYQLANQDKHVSFLWVPGHAGIPGNEAADQAAKRASEKEEWDSEEITSEDFRNSLQLEIKRRWEASWQEVTYDNKLRNIKDVPRAWQSSYRKSRRDEVILARLRIGHTRLTHGHLMEHEDPPLCATCSEQLTVDHILTDCRHYAGERRTCKMTGSAKEILANDEDAVQRILQFTAEANLRREL